MDLIAESGGHWIFIGMESLDPANLADVNKSFNKPAEYADVLNRLAQRNIYAITSFIFGLDNDTPGVAERTLKEMSNWPPGLPVFGLLTPFPATPLYDRLAKDNRLTRPKHWLDFAPFHMAHRPLKISGDQAQAEVRQAWTASYSPAATRRAIDSIRSEPVAYRIGHLVARIFFRGIYFPQTTTWSWLRGHLAEPRQYPASDFSSGERRSDNTKSGLPRRASEVESTLILGKSRFVFRVPLVGFPIAPKCGFVTLQQSVSQVRSRIFRSQVDGRELRARHAVPLRFQAPNRSLGAQHAVPVCTRPKRECIYEMEYLSIEVDSSPGTRPETNGRTSGHPISITIIDTRRI